MKVLTLYMDGDVKLELVLKWSSVFFFRLKANGASYNYRNPFKCLSLALDDIGNG